MTWQKRKPRLVVAWQHHPLGGAQIYLMGIAKRLTSQFEIVFLIPEDTPQTTISYLDESGLSFLRLNMGEELSDASGFRGKLRRRVRKLISESRFVYQTLKHSTKEDVLHVELAPWQSFVGLFVISLLRITFCTVHNRVSRPASWRASLWRLEWSLIVRFTSLQIFATNDDAKNFLGEYMPATSHSRVHVIPTSADMDLIEPVFAEKETHRVDLRSKLGIPPDSIVVLTVGQFIDRKGRREVLDSVPRVCEATNNVEFLWLSDSVAEDTYQSRLALLSEQKRFRLISPSLIGRSRLDVFKMIAAADLFVLPSYVEGLPIALLEAMAMGLPAISTEVNGIPEAIHHGETGFLISIRDSNALSVRIAELISSPDLAYKLGKAGRQKVLHHFNEAEWAGTAGQVYMQSWESNQRGRA
jgi:glycosyltransferase involved in cell wall biosynthesis